MPTQHLCCFHAPTPYFMPPFVHAWCAACRFIPGLPKAYEYARYWGVVSGTAKARAAFRASAVAAAIHPGSVLAYEVYVMNTSEVWHRVPFKTVLGPPVQASEGKSEDSSSDSNRSSGSGSDDGAWWGWLRDLRGLYEPRLQAKMAAAGARDAWDEEWLVRLTTKTVEVRRAGRVLFSVKVVQVQWWWWWW